MSTPTTERTGIREDRRPFFTWLPHPSIANIWEGLEGWRKQFEGILTIKEAGRSTENRPIPAAYVTDPRVDAARKQHVLFSACHAGSELNACTGLLHFIKWLLCDDPDAIRYRREYVVAVLPCVDPDCYEKQPAFRGGPGNPYKDWSWNGPGESPEARALFSVMEALQPEAHVDFHGVPFKEGCMWESTGISWGASLSRCYEPELPRFIDDFVEDRGYLVTRGEHDNGQLLATCEIPGADDHFYLQRASKNATCISYNLYHSLGFIMECGFDDSVVLRARAVLEAGFRRWRYQASPQLPCDHVGIWCSAQLAAWGETAAQRRASRVELWRHKRHTGIGIAHPEHRGTIGAFVTFTAEAAQFLGSPKTNQLAWRTGEWTELLRKLATSDQFDVNGLNAWLAQRPQAPSNSYLNDGVGMHGPQQLESAVAPPQHGVVIRLLIPYRNAEVHDIALDGHLLAASNSDGYQITRGPGCVVHIAIPPRKMRNLHIVTCVYDGREARQAGFTPRDWAITSAGSARKAPSSVATQNEREDENWMPR